LTIKLISKLRLPQAAKLIIATKKKKLKTRGKHNDIFDVLL